MIINRYLIREISKPLVVIFGILAVLFGSFSAASFLSDAVHGLLPLDAIAELIGLKVLISFEVLIPISLLLAVVLTFGKLYGTSEITAMLALRVSPARMMGAVMTLAAGLALIVATLSIVVRPLAYQKMHEISLRGTLQLNIDDMRAGTFYTGDDGNRVIFLSHREGLDTPASDVFVQLRHGKSIQVIFAQLAYKLPDKDAQGGTRIYLRNANIYEIGGKKGEPDRSMNVQGMIINPNRLSDITPGYSSVAASTAHLAASRTPADVAEFQWRLSTAISTLLLAMLGVPLSRAQPRQSRYTRFGTAVVLYFGYYLLCTSARTWVQNGAIGSFPGIWWAPALLALIIATALAAPDLRFRHRPSPA